MKAVAQSQLTSGIQTPRQDDDVVDSSFSSPLYSSQLQERLRLLREETGPDKPQHGFNKNRFVHSIEVLSEDRRKTSELAREQALGTLLTEFVTKYDPGAINYELFSTIVNSFLTARTDVEATTALQLTTAAVTLTEGNESDPRIEECIDLVHQLMPTLLKRIRDHPSADVKAAMTTTFAVLSYFLNAGGGGYGMERVVSTLMEIAEGVSEDDDAPLAASALNGAALITTLTSRGSINEVVSDWLFSMVPMLEVQQLAPKLAAVKVIAVFFELVDPSVLQNGDNREAAEEIITLLESMTQESISRTAKKDKKIQNLLVKSVLKLCRFKLRSPEEIAAAADIDPEDNDVSHLVSQYHRHTLSKGVGVTTWASLVVVEHLRWVFGPGLHSQLANNPYIISLLKREDVQVEALKDNDGDDGDNAPGYSHDSSKQLDAAKRSRELRKQQLRKAEDMGLVE